MQDIDQQVWLAKLRSEEFERERAFFGMSRRDSSFYLHLYIFSFPDEFLDFFVVLCLAKPDEAPADPAHPPSALLFFLAHTQVSYDATYISPMSASILSGPRLGTPPRMTSLKSSGGNSGLHVPPSIFPPNTPNPTPVTTDQDRRYVRAEGVALVSGMWGEEIDINEPRPVEDRDVFALLWDEASGIWVDIGALWSGARFPATHVVLSVAFLRLPVGEPLLCLTASIAVRERPMPNCP